jgi:GT2 family glycosyltransferase
MSSSADGQVTTGPSPSLSIAIVNWNAGTQLGRCLDSIRDAMSRDVHLARVVVVDNASTDGSLDRIREPSDLPLEIVRNSTNRGFAAACNQAARGFSSDYVLFLNPDAAVGRDTISRAVGWMEQASHSRTGILGVQLIDGEGHVARSCARFPTPVTCIGRSLGIDRVIPSCGYMMADWDHEDSRRVDHVIGAFFLVRRSVFEALGGFDESFFVYLEDLDFSCRARMAGWSSYYLADTQAYHKGGGTSERIKSTRLFYALRSRLRYSKKHFSRGGHVCVAVATTLVEPLVRLTACIIARSPSGARETAAAYRMLWRSLIQA